MSTGREQMAYALLLESLLSKDASNQKLQYALWCCYKKDQSVDHTRVLLKAPNLHPQVAKELFAMGATRHKLHLVRNNLVDLADIRPIADVPKEALPYVLQHAPNLTDEEMGFVLENYEPARNYIVRQYLHLVPDQWLEKILHQLKGDFVLSDEVQKRLYTSPNLAASVAQNTSLSLGCRLTAAKNIYVTQTIANEVLETYLKRDKDLMLAKLTPLALDLVASRTFPQHLLQHLRDTLDADTQISADQQLWIDELVAQPNHVHTQLLGYLCTKNPYTQSAQHVEELWAKCEPAFKYEHAVDMALSETVEINKQLVTPWLREEYNINEIAVKASRCHIGSWMLQHPHLMAVVILIKLQIQNTTGLFECLEMATEEEKKNLVAAFNELSHATGRRLHTSAFGTEVIQLLGVDNFIEPMTLMELNHFVQGLEYDSGIHQIVAGALEDTVGETEAEISNRTNVAVQLSKENKLGLGELQKVLNATRL